MPYWERWRPRASPRSPSTSTSRTPWAYPTRSARCTSKETAPGSGTSPATPKPLAAPRCPDRGGPRPGRPRRARRARGLDRAPPARPTPPATPSTATRRWGPSAPDASTPTPVSRCSPHTSRTPPGYDYADWMEQTVVAGLDLVDLEVSGSPAAGYRGSIRDLLAVGRELLAPTLIPEDLCARRPASSSRACPGSCPATDGRSPTTGGWASRSVARRIPTGPARAPPPRPSGTSGRRGPSSGWTRCAGSLPRSSVRSPSAPST